MFDAHCHIEYSDFDVDRTAVLQQARDSGVVGWICAGVSVEGWKKQREVAAQHPDIALAFGLHPHVTARMTMEELESALPLLEEQVQGALGECGMERSASCPPKSLPIQTQAFRDQLAIARDKNIPVILHIVGIHGAALQIMKRDGIPQAGGMLHSYSGSPEMVKEYEKLGLYFSFSAAVTRPRYKKTRAAVSRVPAHRLLIETDCPDQPPYGLEGQRNLPVHLTRVADEVAALRFQRPEQVMAQTLENSQRLYSEAIGYRR